MKATELREKFLKYFEKNNHMRVASASLVPANDPTLFFTNAGMVPFKDVFLGVEKRGYVRATSSQKCMRVSGKHNDLENVGRTPRHHTFFEMLGNFSFGDYFKKEAIAFAWEFLTEELGLAKENLYVTVFQDDDETKKLWKKHVDESRIFKMGEKDNFWSMGDVGPCGPCSEIIYDRTPNGNVRSEDFDTDRFLEVWNLVFMQFNRGADGKLEKLARPSIDTGMGLERLAAVVEKVYGNYETDLFMPVIRGLEKICGKKYTASYSNEAHDDISMRVIADHIRSMVFLIGDGVQPSNEGRGYVLRRIIRRAARHGKLLKIENPFFLGLAHTVIDLMGASYPELIQHRGFIEKVISNEEERFNETLDKGLEILENAFEELKKKGERRLSGGDVFKLYDTFGFPKDLTEDIARDAGFEIDHQGFEKEMSSQRERARSAWKGSGEAAVDSVYKELASKNIKSKFVGYDELSAGAQVIALIKDGRLVDKAAAGDKIGFITDRTPFYGESGGQVGDNGMAVADDLEISIEGATRPMPDMIVHHATIVKGNLKVGSKIALAVDAERRSDISKNHTATHILHRALRETLGEHVKQAGSSVDSERLRFDFSHFSALTKEQIEEIERDANNIVRLNLPVKISEMPYQDAIKHGALAFFGDKYGDVVRTVSVGEYSCELCGGAHIKSSGEIGMIKIVGESSVAAGVRRIEAVTGRGVEGYIKGLEQSVDALVSLLKVGRDELPNRIERLMSENKKLQKDMEKVRSQLYSGRSDALDAEIETVGNVKILSKFVEDVDPKELRTLSDNMKSKIGSGIVMLVTEFGSKTSILISVSKDLTEKLQAGALLKEIVAKIGGTGGGRPDMAQGGSAATGKFAELKTLLTSMVKTKVL